MADGDRPRYRFGPLERRGLVAGWRGGQLAVVAAGLLVAVGLLRARPSVPGAAAAVAVVLVAAAAATWPLGGRTAEEWAPDAVRYAGDRLARRRVGPDPFRGLAVVPVTVEGAPAGGWSGADPAAGRQVGVVVDQTARTYTAVMTASASGFVLLGEGDQARRVAGWAGALAALAREGTAVHRLAWLERSLPDGGRAVRNHLDAQRALDPAEAAARSYRTLVELAGPVIHRHEVLLTVTVHAGRSARAVRAAGGGLAGAAAVLVREVAALRRRLADAEIDTGPLLTAAELAAAVRRGVDPAEAVAAAPAATTARWPWPMATEADWGRLRADGTWHATYWVAEWPRTDVGPDFLGPLLLLSDVRRTTAVVMEPVPPLKAARQVEQARTADVADAELRRRGGFLATARRRREEETLSRREAELADGHGQFRFCGYVTVTADDPDALVDACGRMEQAAAQAGVEIRRCYGDQRRAFGATLPLGRGLP